MSTPKPGRANANAARLQSANAKRNKQQYGQQKRHTGKTPLILKRKDGAEGRRSNESKRPVQKDAAKENAIEDRLDAISAKPETL